MVHHYSFNGNADDSVGGANGVLVGSPTFATANGDMSINLSAGNYVALPSNINLGLTNATIEVFLTGYNPNAASYQPLVQFADKTPGTYGSFGGTYFLLDAGRDLPGKPISEEIGLNGYGAEQRVNGSHTTDSTGLHQEVVTFSGFTTPGSTGTVTLYYDGTQIGQGTGTDTSDSLGPTRFNSIGGPNFNTIYNFFTGSLTDVRIYNGALSGAQVAASFLAGPSGAPVPEASTTVSFGLLLTLGLGGIAIARRRKASASAE